MEKSQDCEHVGQCLKMIIQEVVWWQTESVLGDELRQGTLA